MCERKFQIGDIVRLKGHKQNQFTYPAMTVSEVYENDSVRVLWFIEQKIETADFPTAVLDVIEGQSGTTTSSHASITPTDVRIKQRT